MTSHYIPYPKVKDEIRNIADALKRSIRLSEVVSDFTGAKLVGAGNAKTGCCPFHGDKNPSFTVYNNPNGKGHYECLSSGCNARGDVFTLLQSVTGQGYIGALITGADQYGIAVSDDLRKYVQQDGPSKRTTKAKIYHHSGPSNDVQTAPEDLSLEGYTPIPEGFPTPKPGRYSEIWTNGGTTKIPDPCLKKFKPARVHSYRSIYGEHLMDVLRMEFGDRKFFFQVRLGQPKGDCPEHLLAHEAKDGKKLALMLRPPMTTEARSVYGMEYVLDWLERGGKHILIVEGEKTKEAAHRLLQNDPEWLVLAPFGGGGVSIYADWAPLLKVVGANKVNVAAWPDADKPVINKFSQEVVDRQNKYCNQTLGAIHQRAEILEMPDSLSYFQITPPDGVENGWDLADAEEEGWTMDDVLSHIRANTVRLSVDDLTKQVDDNTHQQAPAPHGAEHNVAP